MYGKHLAVSAEGVSLRDACDGSGDVVEDTNRAVAVVAEDMRCRRSIFGDCLTDFVVTEGVVDLLGFVSGRIKIGFAYRLRVASEVVVID